MRATILRALLVSVQSDASTFSHGRKCDLGDDPGLAAASGEAFARRQKSSEQSESYFKVRFGRKNVNGCEKYKFRHY